jgi:hypothetical protein
VVSIPPFIDYLFRVYNFLAPLFGLISGQGAAFSKCIGGLHCYLLVWIVGFNYWHEIGFDCNVLKIVFVIIGSEICTHRPSLSFDVNEISRNKVVVPEGAAGVIMLSDNF